MNVFMIGGTGLLGSEAAKLFIEAGHSVTSVALPPLPEGAPIPTEMKLIFANFLEMTDDEVKDMMKGMDCFVFCAGVDERVEFPAPVYSAYRKYNIDPVQRLLGIAKSAGVKKAVVLGSYFSYFAKTNPQMKLTEIHPYIASRIEQERVALSFADDDFAVAVLELPYIFGTQPGRKPVWVILVEQLMKMGKVTMYPKGGTTMVTVRQTAQSIVGAAERNVGGNAYPIGYYNMAWAEFLSIVHAAMGVPNRKIIFIQKWMFKSYGVILMKDYKKRNVQPGINAVELAELMCMNTFIDKKWAVSLGVTDDDIRTAIFDSVKLSVEAVNSPTKLLGMKGE